MRRHLRDIDKLARNAREDVDVAEICRQVCAVHAFGLGVPESYLQKLAALPPYMNFDRTVLSKASSFLVKRREKQRDGTIETVIRTRHSVAAELVLREEIRESKEYGEEPLYRVEDFIRLDLQYGDGRRVPKLFQALRLQFNYHYRLKLQDVRPIFELASQNSRIARYVFHIWAGLESRERQFDRACSLYERAVEVAPNDAVIYQAWARLEGRLRNRDKARELFERGTKADPKHAPTWQAWAVMEEKAGNRDKARELFERGTKADPKHAPTWQAWAVMEAKCGEHEKARPLYQRALRLKPSDLGTIDLWIRNETATGDPEKLRACYDTITRQLQPRNPTYWEAWGQFERDRGNHREAERLAAAAKRYR
ncbi:MAG: tetratricopeptide repeat protein [Geitlerinemataceae cyanobacterium]